MKNPVASVIILTFNHVDYITLAINSVLMQETDFDFEIIVADDCSTDSTPIIIEDFRKKYPQKIKVLQNSENLGPVRNYIQAFNYCKGEFIAHCEGDDFWIDKHKLQTQISHLLENPEYGLSHTGVDRLKNGEYFENVNKDMDISLLEGKVFESIIDPDNYIVHTVTAVMRKKLIDEFFDFGIAKEQEWLLLDMPMWATIAYHSKVKYFSKPTACYRISRESLSHSRDYLKTSKFHESVADVRKYLIKKYGVSGELKIKIEKSLFLTRLNDLILAKKYQIFFGELESIFNYNFSPSEYFIFFWAFTRNMIKSLGLLR